MTYCFFQFVLLALSILEPVSWLRLSYYRACQHPEHSNNSRTLPAPDIIQRELAKSNGTIGGASSH